VRITPALKGEVRIAPALKGEEKYLYYQYN